MPIANSRLTQLIQRALRLLAKNPLITVSAMGAWGWRFVEVVRPSLALFTTIIGWIFTAAFFGLVAQAAVRNEHLTWRSVGESIKKFTIGTIVIIMAYTIPLLLAIPILSAAVGAVLQTNLEGNLAVLIIGFSPTVVPSIVATWSLVVRRSSLLDAVKDGVGMLHGKWGLAIIVGLGYQLLAHGTQALRGGLLQADTILFILFEAMWIGIEALLRLTILLLFFDELHPEEKAPLQKRS